MKIDEALVIDGRLDEGMWQSASPLGGFVQAEPFQGQPVSERTEVRILYDDEAIYVGVTLFDANPSLIVTTDTRRDANLGDMDSFQMIFDTFHDQQNGFVFGTNAAGVQYDAQVRFQGNQQASWDGSWDVATGDEPTRRGPPSSASRCARCATGRRRRPGASTSSATSSAPASAPTGRRSSACSTWGACRRPASCAACSWRRRATSSCCPTRSARPTATSRRATTTDFDGDIGLDAKFGVTPSLNLDATVNTDFAQVEVDTQQINLTRFNLRFPEKRPFFQENSGPLHHRQGQRAGSLLQPADRARRERRAGADRRRRAAERQGRRRERRRAEHADGGASASGPATTSRCSAPARSCRTGPASAPCS